MCTKLGDCSDADDTWLDRSDTCPDPIISRVSSPTHSVSIVPTSTGKWESGNFEHTGKVREFYQKMKRWKS